MTFKKLISKILVPLCSFIIPVARLLAPNYFMKKSDYVVAGVLLVLQLLCAFTFYRLTPRWSPYFIKYSERADWPSKLNVVDRVSDLFFTFLILLFAYVLPYSLYLHRQIPIPEMLLCLLFCIDLLGARLYFLPDNTKRKIWNLPFLSLSSLIFFIGLKPISNSTAIVLILLCIFCLEILVSFFVQIIKRS